MPVSLAGAKRLAIAAVAAVLLVACLFIDRVRVAEVQSITTDRAVLVALYNSTDGANWSDSTNWLSEEPLGNWHGVTLDADGRVTDLRLGGNQLTGTIPTELGRLSNLTILILDGNQLTGSIPAGLSSLTSLYLKNN